MCSFLNLYGIILLGCRFLLECKKMKNIKYLFLSLLATIICLFTSACNSSTTPSNNSNNGNESDNLIIGLASNAVYQNNTLLSGTGVILPSGMSIMSMQAIGNVLYVASSFFVYEFNGNTWEILNGSSPDNSPTTSLAIDGSSNLFVSTAKNNVFESVSGSWIQINQAFTESSLNASYNLLPIPQISFGSDQVLYFLTAGGNLYESIGGRFTAYNCGPIVDNNNYITSFHFDSNSNLYISFYDTNGESSTIYESEPNSNNCSAIGISISGEVKSLSYLSSDQESGALAGAINNESSYMYLYSSSTWNQLGSSVPGIPGNRLIAATFGEYPYTTPVAINGSNSYYYYPSSQQSWYAVNANSAPESGNINAVTQADNRNVFAGIDNGNVLQGISVTPQIPLYPFFSGWKSVESGGVSDYSQIKAVIYYKGNIYAAAENLQVYKYNASTWEAIGEPITESHILVNVVINDDNFYAIMNNQYGYQLLHMPVVGESWLATQAKDGFISAFNIVNNQKLAGSGSKVYVISENSGLTPYSNTESVPDLSIITALASDPSYNVYTGTSLGHVYKSTGNSWSQISTTIPDNSAIASLVIGVNNNIYAGTVLGNIYQSANGESWTISKYNHLGTAVNSLTIAP